MDAKPNALERQRHPLSAQILCVTTRHRRVRLEFVEPRVAFPERQVWGPALPQNSMHSLHRRAVVFGRLLVDGWGIWAQGLGLSLQGLASRASGLVFRICPNMRLGGLASPVKLCSQEQQARQFLRRLLVW